MKVSLPPLTLVFILPCRGEGGGGLSSLPAEPQRTSAGRLRVILIYSGGYQVAQNYLMDHTAYVMIEKKQINNNNIKTAQQY